MDYISNTLGWVSIHRTLISQMFWWESTPQQKVVLITLLLLANHKDNTWKYHGKTCFCKAGQLITSYNSLCTKCGGDITKQMVRTALKKLEAYEVISIQSSNSGLFITINDWETLQLSAFTNTQPTLDQHTSNTASTHNQHTGNTVSTPNNNIYNVNNKKNVNNSKTSTNKNKAIFIQTTSRSYNMSKLEQQLLAVDSPNDSISTAQ